MIEQVTNDIKNKIPDKYEHYRRSIRQEDCDVVFSGLVKTQGNRLWQDKDYRNKEFIAYVIPLQNASSRTIKMVEQPWALDKLEYVGVPPAEECDIKIVRCAPIDVARVRNHNAILVKELGHEPKELQDDRDIQFDTYNDYLGLEHGLIGYPMISHFRKTINDTKSNSE